MAVSETPKAPVSVFQLRAEPELLRQVRELAEERGISANRFLIDAIKDTLRLEKEREWREGFKAMGRDADTDVEYLLPAAREVILGRCHARDACPPPR